MDIATRSYLAASVVLALARLGNPHARASSPDDADALVERARATVESLRRNPACAAMKRALARGRAVLVIPQVQAGVPAAGGAGGHGVLLVRDPATGHWAGPVFCTLQGASVGPSARPAGAEVVLVLNSQKALDTLTRRALKLGVDATAAARGAKAAERGAAVGSDVVAYAQARGLYARIALAGAWLDVRDTLNAAYYGQPLTPADILLSAGAGAAGAAALQAALAAAST